MGDATEDRRKAATYPEGDVLGVLYAQHARIRDLFTEVREAAGAERSELFAELRALLVAHETAEEMIVRPVVTDNGGKAVADARNAEEAEATEVLDELDGLEPTDADFDKLLASLEKSVDAHAEAEETAEFPLIERSCDEERRLGMGRMFQVVETIAPTRPHPSTAGSPVAQYAVGPIASLVDHARDAVSKVLPGQ
ncbi:MULTISPECIES: hemerythrin domain-containing protein [unclassified Nocardioides]|jgi:hemerythrin superfamily protein|uniref:hemerythrin domain-containing protein n=1 Tax=Nocardioides sp. URHA0032 TaxID=1380388 RepID=UPI00049164BF|nr:hemerythrin domain-containing protein [Nocardioides sp. URHA0032]